MGLRATLYHWDHMRDDTVYEGVMPVRKYAGRVRQIHIKDMDPATRTFAEVDTGLMDVPALLETATDIGVEWLIVEQDQCARPPLESARISLRNLIKYGLV